MMTTAVTTQTTCQVKISLAEIEIKMILCFEKLCVGHKYFYQLNNQVLIPSDALFDNPNIHDKNNNNEKM